MAIADGVCIVRVLISVEGIDHEDEGVNAQNCCSGIGGCGEWRVSRYLRRSTYQILHCATLWSSNSIEGGIKLRRDQAASTSSSNDARICSASESRQRQSAH